METINARRRRLGMLEYGCKHRLYIRKGGLRYSTTWRVVCTEYPERLAGFCTLIWRGSQEAALAAGLEHAREHHGIVI